MTETTLADTSLQLAIATLASHHRLVGWPTQMHDGRPFERCIAGCEVPTWPAATMYALDEAFIEHQAVQLRYAGLHRVDPDDDDELAIETLRSHRWTRMAPERGEGDRWEYRCGAGCVVVHWPEESASIVETLFEEHAAAELITAGFRTGPVR